MIRGFDDKDARVFFVWESVDALKRQTERSGISLPLKFLDERRDKGVVNVANKVQSDMKILWFHPADVAVPEYWPKTFLDFGEGSFDLRRERQG